MQNIKLESILIKYVNKPINRKTFYKSTCFNQAKLYNGIYGF